MVKMRGGLLAVALWIALSGSASASAPALGGHYRGSVEWKGQRCQGCAELHVANDGLSFQGFYSYVSLGEHPRLPDSCAFNDGVIVGIDNVERFGDQFGIAPDGYFRGTERDKGHYARVVGRFRAGGRAVSGTLVIRERRDGCRLNARTRFRARLVGRTYPPTPGRFAECDEFYSPLQDDVAQDRTDVFDRDVGCTTARDAASHRLADAVCQHLTIGQYCAAGYLFCTPIERGEHEAAAQTRCDRGDGTSAAVEIVAWQGCRPRYDADVVAANVACQQARALAGFYMENLGGRCGGFVTCSVKGTHAASRATTTPA